MPGTVLRWNRCAKGSRSCSITLDRRYLYKDRAYAVLLFAASGQRQSMTSENWPASLTNTPENEAQRDFDRKWAQGSRRAKNFSPRGRTPEINSIRSYITLKDHISYMPLSIYYVSKLSRFPICRFPSVMSQSYQGSYFLSAVPHLLCLKVIKVFKFKIMCIISTWQIENMILQYYIGSGSIDFFSRTPRG
jgi:hypothetical protein